MKSRRTRFWWLDIHLDPNNKKLRIKIHSTWARVIDIPGKRKLLAQIVEYENGRGFPFAKKEDIYDSFEAAYEAGLKWITEFLGTSRRRLKLAEKAFSDYLVAYAPPKDKAEIAHGLIQSLKSSTKGKK